MNPFFSQLIRPAYRHARYVGSRLRDYSLGITTTDECIAREFGEDFSDYYYFHRAVSFSGIHRLMRHLDPGPKDALLDIGCGAGRVICLAAQYPFSRIVGIDIDDKFCALAERNVRSLRRCSVRPEVYCTDAATYRVPDDITIVFLYNPFGGEVMRPVLTRVLESHDRAPRPMRLVYMNPIAHDVVMEMGRFREAEQLLLSWRPGAEWARTQLVRFYDVEPRT